MQKGKSLVYMNPLSDTVCWIAGLVDMGGKDMTLSEELAAAANNLVAVAAEQCSVEVPGFDIPAVVSMALVLAVPDDIVPTGPATEDATDLVPVVADVVEVVLVLGYHNNTTKLALPIEVYFAFEAVGMHVESA